MVGRDQKVVTFYAAVNECFKSEEPGYCLIRNVNLIERRAQILLLKSLQFLWCFTKATVTQPTESKIDDFLQQVGFFEQQTVCVFECVCDCVYVKLYDCVVVCL